MSESERIVRRKLSDEVLDRLTHIISDRELEPGDEMPSERELMTRFQVGRPAIREAMQAMANMGLVAISHGERAKVLQLSAKSIIKQVDATAKMMLASSKDLLEDLKSARIFFERGMAREAAHKASDQDVAELRKALAAQKEALNDPNAFINADMRLHTQIAMISRNPIYVAVSEAMLSWLQIYHTEMLIWTGKENVTLSEHEEIIECIARHDGDAAENAMIKHLERSRALYAQKPL